MIHYAKYHQQLHNHICKFIVTIIAASYLFTSELKYLYVQMLAVFTIMSHHQCNLILRLKF